jgi:hypothetical protein
VAVAEHLAAELEGLLIERLGLAIAPLAQVETGQIVEAPKGNGVGLASTSRLSCRACS